MNFARRLKALERPFREEKPFRLITHNLVGKLVLDTSTCIRTRCRDGTLTEWLHFNGPDPLTEEQLQAFVDRFPINYL
jgi:hypothetical protein